MGEGKIDVKALKANGDIEIKILEQDGKQTGTVYAKYNLKSLAPVPFLIIKSAKCDFYKDTEFVLKTVHFTLFRNLILLSLPTEPQSTRNPKTKAMPDSWYGMRLCVRRSKTGNALVSASKIRMTKTTELFVMMHFQSSSAPQPAQRSSM